MLLLSGDISLDLGVSHQGTRQCSNEWNIFKNRGLHFIYLNINSFLSKLEELRFIAKSTNAAVIDIYESKLDASVIAQEVNTDNQKILRHVRNRHGRGVACYIKNNLSYNTRNDLSYNILSVFPCKIENIFIEVLLPNSKPMIVGTTYLPSSQNNFLELLNSNINKIDLVGNELYILGDLT